LINQKSDGEDWWNEIAWFEEDKCYHHADTGFIRFDIDWLAEIIMGQVDWCEIEEVKS